jgi:hypothetical protein
MLKKRGAVNWGLDLALHVIPSLLLFILHSSLVILFLIPVYCCTVLHIDPNNANVLTMR